MSFEGLAQGARICRKLGIVTNRAAKKMTDVDITFNMMKHMNAIRARDFATEMQEGMISPAGAKEVAPEKETNNLEEESKNKAAAPLAPTPVGKTAPVQAGQSGPTESKKDEAKTAAAPLAKTPAADKPAQGQAGQSGPKNALFPTCRQLQAGVVPKKKGKQDEEPTVKGQQQPQKESANRAPPQAQAAVGTRATATATTATATSRQTSPNSHVTCQVCKARGEQTTTHALPLASMECRVCWTAWPRDLPAAAFTPAYARQCSHWFTHGPYAATTCSTGKDTAQQQEQQQQQQLQQQKQQRQPSALNAFGHLERPIFSSVP